MGVSTFTRYSGFNVDNSTITNRTLNLSGENTSTGDIIVDDGTTLVVGVGSTASVGEVDCLSVKHHFSVPSGNTNQRDEQTVYIEGTMRYNTDIQTLEFFNGEEWKAFNYQLDIQNSPASRGTAYFGGGDSPTLLTNVSKVNFRSLGNAIHFGDLTVARTNAGGGANEIRGIWAGGEEPNATDELDYLAMCSGGNGADFGDYIAGTRNLFGYGNAIRGVWGGGEAGPAMTDDIGYINYTSLGNAVFFGDLTQVREVGSGASSPTRVLMMGGYINPGTNTNSCEYVQIMTTGNSKEFGDLNVAGRGGAGTSNSTRAITGGSHDNGNEIQSVEMSTTGNFVDFGDLTIGRSSLSAASNAHGGLG